VAVFFADPGFRYCLRCHRAFVPNNWDAPGAYCSLTCSERGAFSLPSGVEILIDPPAVAAARELIAERCGTGADQ
jgi:hypothetical protein